MIYLKNEDITISINESNKLYPVLSTMLNNYFLLTDNSDAAYIEQLKPEQENFFKIGDILKANDLSFLEAKTKEITPDFVVEEISKEEVKRLIMKNFSEDNIKYVTSMFNKHKNDSWVVEKSYKKDLWMLSDKNKFVRIVINAED